MLNQNLFFFFFNYLGCVADLVKNQTSELRRQLEEPLRELARKLLDYLNRLKSITDTIQQGLQPVLNALHEMRRGISNSIDAVRRLANVRFDVFSIITKLSENKSLNVQGNF